MLSTEAPTRSLCSFYNPGMNNLQRILGVLLAFSLFAPALAAAQLSTGSSTIDAQIQTLLGQITSLQQELKSLVQSVVPTSTPPHIMDTASSTLGGMSGMMGGENCPGFVRDLSEGSQGSDVMQLQQMLSGDGFLSASSTGFFGPMTARALQAFQIHFGISASSSATGFFGALTRNFLSAHCGGEGRGGMMGSSTSPMRPIGTSTPFWGGPGPRMMGSSTTDEMYGPMGTSTGPRPCPNNDNQGAAAGLFIPHAILPMMPCGNGDSISDHQ